MRRTARLGYGLLKKELLLLLRYRVNTVSYLITMYVVFLTIFIGGRELGGEAFDDSLSAIIVGWFLITISHNAFNGVARTFIREASWGTLEQLYLAPTGFGRMTAFIAVVRMLISFVWGVIILGLMIVTTGKTVAVAVTDVVPIAALAISSIVGFGFVFGGAAILYKRIGSSFTLMQFVIVGLVAAPVGTVPALKLLPLAQGSYLLRLVMSEGRHVGSIPPTELGLLVLTGVGYPVLGYLVLKKTIDVAKRRGVMGHY